MKKRTFRFDLNGKADHSLQYLLGMITDTRTVTLQLLGKLTPQELDWQCQPGWNTIGALLDHIAAIQHFFRIEFVDDRKLTDAENDALLPALDMGEHLPKLIGIKSIADYQHTLTEAHDQLINALQKISFEDFTRKRAGYNETNGCNLAWVLYHMVEDEIYHRGQISMIRKLWKER